jgi:hypothetical protein
MLVSFWNNYLVLLFVLVLPMVKRDFLAQVKNSVSTKAIK